MPPPPPYVPPEPSTLAGSGAPTPAAGSGEVTSPDQPVTIDCGQQSLTAERQTILTRGNVLVVFDRSGSMEADWGGMPKFQAAGSAFRAAIEPLKDHLSVGGVFFPTVTTPTVNPLCVGGCDPGNILHWLPGPTGCCLSNTQLPTCDVSPIESVDQIDFTTAEAFSAALPLQWHVPNATGTPLEAGLARAAQAISARTFSDPLTVFVMTDGEPNCSTDQEDVIAQVSAWKAANISTYVIGLPGAQGAAELLTQMAQAGGSPMYIEPRDPGELEARLRTVISSSVRTGFSTCTFQIAPTTEVPDKLRLVVTQGGVETTVPCGLAQNPECQVSPGGDQAVLSGSLCVNAQSGNVDGLRFLLGCPDPIEPEPIVW